jgi:hypothetical protein
VEQGQQTVPEIPSHTLESKAPDFTKDAEQFQKKRDRIEDLVSEMGGAIDVVRIPAPDVDQLENEEILQIKNKQYSDTTYGKNLPNVSIFDSTTEDFPIESNSSRWEANEKQVNSGDITAAELGREQEDKPLTTAAITDDFPEYQADDSDRVYAVRKDAEGENIDDEDNDADNLPNGSSVQHDLTNRADVSEKKGAIESRILARLEDRTVEEVRIALYSSASISAGNKFQDLTWLCETPNNTKHHIQGGFKSNWDF